jgi:WD40 repeat protein
VQLWNLTNGVLFATLGGGGNLSCAVSFSSDGNRIAAGGQDGTVYMWDMSTGLSLITEKGHAEAVTSVFFFPDSTCLASASSDKAVYLWDVRTGRFLSRLCGHDEGITGMAFSPDSSRIASASSDCTIRIWDRTPVGLLTLKGHKGTVTSIAFSPFGTHIASGSADETVRLWDVSTGKCIATNHAHKRSVVMVKFSSDGRSVISISDDMSVKMFTIAGGKSITVWSMSHFVKMVLATVQSRRIKALSFIPDIAWGYAVNEHMGLSLDAAAFSASTTPLAVAVKINTFILRDLEPIDHLPFMGRAPASSALAFSLDSTCIASGSPVKDISICDPKITDGTWEQMQIKWHLTDIVAASPDGTRFVVKSGAEVSLLDAQGSLICQLLSSVIDSSDGTVFSPDSRLVALPAWSGSIHIFDAQSGAILQGVSSTLRGMLISDITRIIFSPDGSHIAVGNTDHIVQLRSIATGRQVARLQKAFKEDITCLKFSPDGSCIALGDSTGVVKCWEWNTDRVRINSSPHRAAVTSIVFTPNGAQIISGSDDGSLQVWIPESDSTPCQWKSSSMATMSLAFQSSSSGLQLYCRSKEQAVEIWDFGRDEKDEPVAQGPHMSWHTDDGCFLPDQTLERNFYMRNDGWLFDGDSRICWVPKFYRPNKNQFFMGQKRLLCTTDHMKHLLVLDFSTTEKVYM